MFGLDITLEEIKFFYDDLNKILPKLKKLKQEESYHKLFNEKFLALSSLFQAVGLLLQQNINDKQNLGAVSVNYELPIVVLIRSFLELIGRTHKLCLYHKNANYKEIENYLKYEIVIFPILEARYGIDLDDQEKINEYENHLIDLSTNEIYSHLFKGCSFSSKKANIKTSINKCVRKKNIKTLDKEIIIYPILVKETNSPSNNFKCVIEDTLNWNELGKDIKRAIYGNFCAAQHGNYSYFVQQFSIHDNAYISENKRIPAFLAICLYAFLLLLKDNLFPIISPEKNILEEVEVTFKKIETFFLNKLNAN